MNTTTNSLQRLAAETLGSRKRSQSINDAQVTVLLVEDASADTSLIQTALAGARDGAFLVETVARLSDALARLRKGGVGVVLLDLRLPDGQGLEVYDRVFVAAPNTPILILTQASDEALAREAVQRGAHDYLLKDHADAHLLSRTLRYVIDGKAALDTLQNSETRFRAMSDASPLGIFVSDMGGSCVYTNAAYQRISGQSFEQTLGTNWSMAIHHEDRKRVLADWHDAAQSDAPLKTEYRFQRKDGSVVWTRVNSAAIHDGIAAHGHVQTVEDITERKSTESSLRAAEEALFEEKERAQVMLNSIGDAVLATDLGVT